jgi:hypothetical protein
MTVQRTNDYNRIAHRLAVEVLRRDLDVRGESEKSGCKSAMTIEMALPGVARAVRGKSIDREWW